MALVYVFLIWCFTSSAFSDGYSQPRYRFKVFTALANVRVKPNTSIIKSLVVQSASECSLECTKHSLCLSYNVAKHTTTGGSEIKCELLNLEKAQVPTDQIEDNGQFNYFTIQVSFLNSVYFNVKTLVNLIP